MLVSDDDHDHRTLPTQHAHADTHRNTLAEECRFATSHTHSHTHTFTHTVCPRVPPPQPAGHRRFARRSLMHARRQWLTLTMRLVDFGSPFIPIVALRSSRAEPCVSLSVVFCLWYISGSTGVMNFVVLMFISAWCSPVRSKPF